MSIRAKLNLELMQGLPARMQERDVAFQSALTAALCRRLTRDHIRLSNCPVVKATPAIGKARPPKLLTTHL